MASLTVHVVVKNEPFIYYAVKAVYDDADVILLYDTGSDDLYTLSDIDRLLSLDTEKKIKFKSVPIAVDQTGWTFRTLEDVLHRWDGLFGVADVRQMQIDDTDTEYFLLVDGDEIHYDGSVKRIKERLLPFMAHPIVKLPRVWYYDMNTLFGNRVGAGRVFKTDKVYIKNTYPDEVHAVKGHNGDVYSPEVCGNFSRTKSIAHFEAYLKPWRRTRMTLPKMRPSDRPLPEVMVRDPYYIERFESERADNSHGSPK